MKLDKFKKIIANTAPEKRELISRNMDILERIHELLDMRFQGKQNLLAERMGKTEPEISKLLSGIHNYTMQTIIKLELAFEAPILYVSTSKDLANANFVQAKFNKCLQKQMDLVNVHPKGVVTPDKSTYKSVVKMVYN